MLRVAISTASRSMRAVCVPAPARLASTAAATPAPKSKLGLGYKVVGVAAACGAAAVGYHTAVADLRSTAGYRWLLRKVGMPVLRMMDPEDAHKLAIQAAAHGFAPIAGTRNPTLECDVLGLKFANPIGLAAGFDKQGEAMGPLLGAGFGFVEVGTVTPQPQPGNPRPRMFRLTEDGAVINRFGFNSDGGATVAERLASYWESIAPTTGTGIVDISATGAAGGAGSAPAAAAAGASGLGPAPPRRGLVGVNIGKNKEGDAVMDYRQLTWQLAPYADYLVVNVSSPNTPGLRALQGEAELRKLLSEVKTTLQAIPWGANTPADDAGVGVVDETTRALRRPANWGARVAAAPARPPLLVKIAPDLTEEALVGLVQVVKDVGIDGIIVSNTTIARPEWLRSPHAAETGGLSGRPLFVPSTNMLFKVYQLTDGKVPLIGVGGVSTAREAYLKIRCGASLVQVYSALAYQGPGLAAEIADGVADLLRKDCFADVSEAVGIDVRNSVTKRPMA